MMMIMMMMMLMHTFPSSNDRPNHKLLQRKTQTGRRDEMENGMNQRKLPWQNTSKSAPVVAKFNFSIGGFYPKGSV